MTGFRITIYESHYQQMRATEKNTWILLQDMEKEASHVFCISRGPHNSVSGGYGLLKKSVSIPLNVQACARISLSEATYTQMLQEGNGLNKQFVFYENGEEGSMIH